MKNRCFRFRLPLLATLVFAGFLPFGRAEWEPLFDGKTLAGWTQRNGWAEYRVEDGAIVGRSVPDSPNSFLCTERDYGDFVLTLEVKLEEGMNSGIQFRSESKPDYRDGRVHGYQFELDTSDRRWTGGIFDEARRGWLYPVDLNPAAKPLFRQNEWNQVRIECVGNSLRTWLNGRPVAHVIDDRTPRGFIALQVHGVGNKPERLNTEVAWRNIRINTVIDRPTPDAAGYIRNLVPNTLSADERAQGWRLLWDGRTAAGWRQVGGRAFPAAGWAMTDGVLTVLADEPGQPPEGGDIATVDRYGAFEFDFEFRPAPGANSGIKYFVTAAGAAALGLEYQIYGEDKFPDDLPKLSRKRSGSLYDLIPAAGTVSFRRVPLDVGEWNHGRIICRPDGRVEHWLNGFKVVAYTRGDEAFRALVARSKYAEAAGFGLGPDGPLSLQDHHDRVSFRSLKLREL